MTRLRILFIEDDAETRIAVKRGLEEKGLVVDAVWNGDKGMQAINDGNFDCVLLDLIMPGMNGFQVLDSLKSSENTRDLPIVVLTAKDDENTRKQAMKAGADEFITKPFAMDEVIKKITSLVKEDSGI